MGLRVAGWFREAILADSNIGQRWSKLTMSKPVQPPQRRILNKKAHLNYHILEKVEAGISLKGPEVKSLREGTASLEDAWARVDPDGVVLINFQIDPYRQATTVE